jgi:D-alanine-D-alanine ligase
VSKKVEAAMSPTKLKVAILYDVWEGNAGEPEPAPVKRSLAKKAKKEKEDREEIFDALGKLGHEPSYQVLDGSKECLGSLEKCGADLVFNLTESFAGDDTKEMNVTAYLVLLGLPYTGAGPHAHFLAQDKGTAKKMFAFHGIRTPYFATSYRGRIEHAHDIEFPLIVKPIWEDGSIGISAEAVVHGIKELMQRVEYIQDEFDSPALIEEYIEGREIYAGVLGSYEKTEMLPLVELDLSRLPAGTPKIASYDVKFEKDTDVHRLTKSSLAKNLDQSVIERLSETALKAYRAVKLRDYGRIDMRLAANGKVYVIEANPNPWLSSKQEFAMAAKASGRSYTDLIGEIVNLALARHNLKSRAQAQRS